MNGWFRCRAPSEDPVMFALGFDALGLRLRDAYLELLAFCSSNRRDGLFRTGRDFVGQLESAARWRGRKGTLVDALLAAGAIEGSKDAGFVVFNNGRWGPMDDHDATPIPPIFSASEIDSRPKTNAERQAAFRARRRATTERRPRNVPGVTQTVASNESVTFVVTPVTEKVTKVTEPVTASVTEVTEKVTDVTPCVTENCTDRKTRGRDERQKTKDKNNDNISSTESVRGTGAAETAVPAGSSAKNAHSPSPQPKPADADLSLDTLEATRWKAPSEKTIWDEPKIEVKNPDFPRTSVLCRLLWDSFDTRKRDMTERELFEAIKPFEKTLPDRKRLRSIVVRFFSSLDWMRDHGRYRPKLSTFVDEEMWTWDDPEQDGPNCDYIWFLEKRRDRLERLGVHLPLVMDPLKIKHYKAPITAWVARRADMWGLAEKLERAEAAHTEGRAA